MEEQTKAQARWAVESLLARRTRGMRGSDIRDAFKLTERPDLISLAGGFPDEAAFPLDEVAGLIERLLAREGGRVFQYGPTEGSSELRSRVAEGMGRLGVAVPPEEVLLTSGSQQALDLIGRVLLDPGDVVLVESPGYVGGLSAFAAYEAQLVGVEMDREGLIPEDLERQLLRLRREGARVKLLYTVPTFQNPTGACLPAERRAALLDLAAEYGFLIVEDDPYREICFGSPPPPPLAATGAGRVLYLGSFSKVFLPGLRVGWVAGPAELIARLSLAKQPADLCSSLFGQKLVEAYLAEGRLAPRTAVLREEYRVKCEALHEALRAEDLPIEWERPGGGFFLWVTLPEGGDARRLLETARREGVAFVPGEAFHVTAGGGRRSLRLAYSQSSPERLREAAARLGRAIRAHLSEKAGIFPAPVKWVDTPLHPARGAAAQ
ncbi:MAG: PLP-dependent aminotransferase family protein [Bacillota bacterium]|nr:PLP-dependent aminotransferase family protein [Bacillota bacterium]